MTQPPAGAWQPVPGGMLTSWGAGVNPENAWQEYPRPQLRRQAWLNLNGLWEYVITPLHQEDSPWASEPGNSQGFILVPYPIESALSGVGRLLEADELLWYRRRFTLPSDWQMPGGRILLHFGAVDWAASAWLNGELAGSHQGGYTSFSLDITSLVQEGENELIVRAWDPTDAAAQEYGGPASRWQSRGKQTCTPRSIWYTRVSGIWQTVWLEPVAASYITSLKVTPLLQQSPAGELQATLRVKVCVSGNLGTPGGSIQIIEAGQPISQSSLAFTPNQAGAEAELVLPVHEPRLWNPDSPFLYDLQVEAGEDRVESYFGLRKFSLGHDGRGQPRFCLNDKPLFLFGPLDQGYWPDGLYTPPSEAALRADLELVKSLGCNMLRKHVKVEPARFYYECDRLGLIVWQDMVNGGKAVGDLVSLLAILFNIHRDDRRALQRAGRELPEARQAFRQELEELIDQLENFTSIAVWVPFNEGWGQFNAREIAEWVKARDPSRLVDHASGWFDQGAGDFKSLHVYFKRLPGIGNDNQRAVALTEFGGYSLKVAGHQWDPAAEFGYRKFKTTQALTEAYLALLETQLMPLVAAGLSAAIYTQLSDVEIEVNGYVTYDRAVEKMDFNLVRQAHARLFQAFSR